LNGTAQFWSLRTLKELPFNAQQCVTSFSMLLILTEKNGGEGGRKCGRRRGIRRREVGGGGGGGGGEEEEEEEVDGYGIGKCKGRPPRAFAPFEKKLQLSSRLQYQECFGDSLAGRLLGFCGCEVVDREAIRHAYDYQIFPTNDPLMKTDDQPSPQFLSVVLPAQYFAGSFL
jgi:hypothetical protein